MSVLCLSIADWARWLWRKHGAPVVLHADDRPALGQRLVPALAERLQLVGAIVCVLARRIVVMNEEREAWTTAVPRPLQHLQVAIGVAERGNRPTADPALNADRLAFFVVDEIHFG